MKILIICNRTDFSNFASLLFRISKFHHVVFSEAYDGYDGYDLVFISREGHRIEDEIGIDINNPDEVKFMSRSDEYFLENFESKINPVTGLALESFFLSSLRGKVFKVEKNKVYSIRKMGDRFLLDSTVPFSEYFSQEGQDIYVDNDVFKGKNGLTFVDVGAHDGKTLNNTLFFEQTRKWTGINIEPIPSVFATLTRNRPGCVNINGACSDFDGTSKFILVEGYSEMLSGLKDDYDERHYQRLIRETNSLGGSVREQDVATYKLSTILEKNKCDRVNYLSIDVEGAELSVVKGIDFTKVFIDLIGFENNYDDKGQEVVNYLSRHGYKIINKGIDIFMIHENSEYA